MGRCLRPSSLQPWSRSTGCRAGGRTGWWCNPWGRPWAPGRWGRGRGRGPAREKEERPCHWGRGGWCFGAEQQGRWCARASQLGRQGQRVPTLARLERGGVGLLHVLLLPPPQFLGQGTRSAPCWEKRESRRAWAQRSRRGQERGYLAHPERGGSGLNLLIHRPPTPASDQEADPGQGTRSARLRPRPGEGPHLLQEGAARGQQGEAEHQRRRRREPTCGEQIPLHGHGQRGLGEGSQRECGRSWAPIRARHL
jgi:hypothetical protein